jgi:hypothetical protein
MIFSRFVAMIFAASASREESSREQTAIKAIALRYLFPLAFPGRGAIKRPNPISQPAALM